MGDFTRKSPLLGVQWLISNSVSEAFKRKKQKYIGLLPIGGTPPPQVFPRLFPRGDGHNWEKNYSLFTCF